jgi:hypothetical protein
MKMLLNRKVNINLYSIYMEHFSVWCMLNELKGKAVYGCNCVYFFMDEVVPHF